jgi:regulatory protein
VAARARTKAPPDLSPERCHDRALRLLSFRARSTREMSQRLIGAGFPEDVVRGEVDRLTEVGLLDDGAFAADFTRSSVNFRKLGRRSVRAGLAAKGVDRALVEEATSALTEESEQARADELALVRVRRLKGKDRASAFASLAGFLMRRGFDPSVARRAAGRALAVEIEPD